MPAAPGAVLLSQLSWPSGKPGRLSTCWLGQRAAAGLTFGCYPLWAALLREVSPRTRPNGLVALTLSFSDRYELHDNRRSTSGRPTGNTLSSWGLRWLLGCWLLCRLCAQQLFAAAARLSAHPGLGPAVRWPPLGPRTKGPAFIENPWYCPCAVPRIFCFIELRNL